jgi:hypothetical protein
LHFCYRIARIVKRQPISHFQTKRCSNICSKSDLPVPAGRQIREMGINPKTAKAIGINHLGKMSASLIDRLGQRISSRRGRQPPAFGCLLGFATKKACSPGHRMSFEAVRTSSFNADL